MPIARNQVSANATVTGDLGAYYIGAWTLQAPAHGLFVGITLQNQGAPQNNFLPTLDIEGGTWGLEHCEIRGALNSVVAARFASCVTARRCGIGGWPNGDFERNALNGVSASGCSRVRVHACSLDLCSNAALRFMGNSSGEVFGCLLQLNNIHLAASEFAHVHARLNTMGEVGNSDGPDNRDDQADDQGDGLNGLGKPPIELSLAAGCLKVVDCSTLVLERNTIHDSWTGSVFHLASTNRDDEVDPAVRQVVTGEPGEDFARRMAQGFFAGRAVDEVPTCKEDLPEGWTLEEDFTLADMEEALKNESMPVWVGVNKMLDEACARKGWNHSEALMTLEEVEAREAAAEREEKEAETLKAFKDHLTLWEFQESVRELDDKLNAVGV